MTVPADTDAILERLARQDPREKRIRNALIQQGIGLREATRRAAETTGRIRPHSAAADAVIAEAVNTAAARAVAGLRAARKARKAARRARERTPVPGAPVRETAALAAPVLTESELRRTPSHQLRYALLTSMPAGESPFCTGQPGPDTPMRSPFMKGLTGA